MRVEIVKKSGVSRGNFATILATASSIHPQRVVVFDKWVRVGQGRGDLSSFATTLSSRLWIAMMPSTNSERPLSPHLSVYRWQVTNTLSILHRLTGVALSAGMLVLSAWLISAAWFPESFTCLRDMLASIPGKVALFGWTAAFYYHLANGMRHLNWDMGMGFKLHEVTRSAWVVVVFTATMTLFTWAVALGMVTL